MMMMSYSVTYMVAVPMEVRLDAGVNGESTVIETGACVCVCLWMYVHVCMDACYVYVWYVHMCKYI